MSKLISSTKVILLLAFMAVAFMFYNFMSADVKIKSEKPIIKKEDKGMTVEEFQKKISQKDKLVFVYFNASWCVPCIKLKPEMAELEKDTKAYCEILNINVDDHPKIAEFYEINSLPMFVIYKNGKKLWENIGILSKTQLQSKIDSFSK